MKNPYLPLAMRTEKIVIETDDKNIKTFSLSFLNEEDESSFNYLPGQFVQLSVLSEGEAPFGIASSPTQPGELEFTVNKIGVLTTALHNLEKGAIIGIRGPLGNCFPIEAFEGKNIVIVSGGFAFTTLRSLLKYILYEENRSKFGNVTVIYGARRPGLLLYKDELKEWEVRPDLDVHLTVDRADDGWRGKVGVVPNVIKEVAPSPENAYTVVCGPPIMIKLTLPVLRQLGFPPERIILSLEMKMKCGIGMCGRCNIGNKYVCKDGPIFTLAHLNELSGEYKPGGRNFETKK
ncbi:MAG: heterodisulfide reductase subunit F [Dehalococcoidia bacterium]|nr:MAG: heterodisulfide reductase subunit F [Dehalococcoidia bacterium]